MTMSWAIFSRSVRDCIQRAAMASGESPVKLGWAGAAFLAGWEGVRFGSGAGRIARGRRIRKKI
jgi:hypothetical protein